MLQNYLIKQIEKNVKFEMTKKDLEKALADQKREIDKENKLWRYILVKIIDKKGGKDSEVVLTNCCS